MVGALHSQQDKQRRKHKRQRKFKVATECQDRTPTPQSATVAQSQRISTSGKSKGNYVGCQAIDRRRLQKSILRAVGLFQT
ncbi:hypothetical protein TNCV_103711 [Trichonephila clavipes]|nr:hypothetical protein TNCV_103711 [Trichonephila clavipes]